MDVEIKSQALHDGGRMFRVGVRLSGSFHDAGLSEALKDYSAQHALAYKSDHDAIQKISDQIGSAALNREVADYLAAKAAPTVINKLNMHIMFNPQAALEDMTDVMQPGPCDLTIDMVLKPIMHLSDYGPLTVHLPKAHVTDEEVDQAISNMLDQFSTYEDAGSGPLERGEFARLDLETTHGDKPVKNLSGKGFSLQADDAFLPSEMVKNLIGMKPGETREFDFHFNEDDIDAYHVKATLTGREVRNVPAFNDEFVKKNMSDRAQTADELRSQIKKDLTDQVAQQIEQQKEQFVDAELAKRLDSKIVNLYYERARENMMDTVKQQLAAQGLTMDQFMQQQQMSEQQFNMALMMQVGQSLHQGFALDALFDHLDEEPTEEEMDTSLAQMAGSNVEKARKDLDEHHTWFVVRDAAERLHAHNYAVKHTTFVYDDSNDDGAASEDADR